MKNDRKLKVFDEIDCAPKEEKINNKKIKDLKGLIFNGIEVLYYVGSKGGRAHYLCVCPFCKKYFVVNSHNLQNGHTKSCGCLVSIKLREDIVGKEFNRLKVLKYDKSINENPYWEVECLECGKIYSVSREALKNGQYSCGCVKKSVPSLLIKDVLVDFGKKTGRNISTEKTFDDCIFKSKLKFDLCVESNDENNMILIEYDGQQHFKPVKFSKKTSDSESYCNFITNQITDWIKDLYCISNNIKFIRVKYLDKKNKDITYDELLQNSIIVGKEQGYDKKIEAFDINECDFVNYKEPTFNIASGVSCTFKCGADLCQNCELTKAKIVPTNIDKIIRRYEEQDLVKSVTFQGLEPLDNLRQMLWFIYYFRQKFNDTIIIWTGYTKEECKNLEHLIKNVMEWKNIVVKFGRYVPNQEKHYDDILGVYLASDNQYAEVIS